MSPSLITRIRTNIPRRGVGSFDLYFVRASKRGHDASFGKSALTPKCFPAAVEQKSMAILGIKLVNNNVRAYGNGSMAKVRNASNEVAQ
jgi:hypothetical protein